MEYFKFVDKFWRKIGIRVSVFIVLVSVADIFLSMDDTLSKTYLTRAEPKLNGC